MKLNYIAVYDKKRACGVYHKIIDQLKGLEDNGLDTQLIRLGQWTGTVSVLGRKIELFHCNWKDLKIEKGVEAIYIRYQRSDFNFLSFLRKLKRENKNRKIIIEIATYPYEAEDGAGAVYIQFKDRVCRQFLRFYVDRIVTYSDDNKIWGIKTIRGVNGIDFSKVSIKKPNKNLDNGIDMIAVASMCFWHGYDRMIEGIQQYVKKGGKRPIRLHLVGNGEEIPKYMALVNKYHLEDQVIFYGQKEGKELDEIYDMCDIGLVGFGYQRIGLSMLSSLKSREYTAKGIPIVIAGKIDVFSKESYRFVCQMQENESSIDIEQLIHWYDGLKDYYGTPNQMNGEIRRAAFEKCDIHKVMRNVSEYILQNN